MRFPFTVPVARDGAMLPSAQSACSEGSACAPSYATTTYTSLYDEAPEYMAFEAAPRIRIHARCLHPKQIAARDPCSHLHGVSYGLLERRSRLSCSEVTSHNSRVNLVQCSKPRSEHAGSALSNGKGRYNRSENRGLA